MNRSTNKMRVNNKSAITLKFLFFSSLIIFASCNNQQTTRSSSQIKYSNSSDQSINNTNNLAAKELKLIDADIFEAPEIETQTVLLGHHQGVNITVTKYPDDAKYFEFYICSADNDSNCSPSKDRPKEFGVPEHMFPSPPTGAVTVSVRACVRTYHAQNESANCGQWGSSTPILIKENSLEESDQIKNLLEQGYTNDMEVRAKCREIHVMAKTMISKYEKAQFKDSGFETLVQNIIATGEDECSEMYLNGFYSDVSDLIEATQGDSQGDEELGLTSEDNLAKDLLVGSDKIKGTDTDNPLSLESTSGVIIGGVIAAGLGVAAVAAVYSSVKPSAPSIDKLDSLMKENKTAPFSKKTNNKVNAAMYAKEKEILDLAERRDVNVAEAKKRGGVNDASPEVKRIKANYNTAITDKISNLNKVYELHTNTNLVPRRLKIDSNTGNIQFWKDGGGLEEAPRDLKANPITPPEKPQGFVAKLKNKVNLKRLGVGAGIGALAVIMGGAAAAGAAGAYELAGDGYSEDVAMFNQRLGEIHNEVLNLLISGARNYQKALVTEN